MEFFPCGDLKQRLLHPLDAGQALTITRKIAAALCVTHAAGIVHRDLKPPNVMLRADGTLALARYPEDLLPPTLAPGGASELQPTRMDANNTPEWILVMRGS